MTESRRLGTERLKQCDLHTSIGDMIVAPDDVSDPHIHVIHDYAKVVRGRAVGARDDQIVQLGVLERHVAVNDVLHDHDPIQRILESDDR